ncbi:MAG: hypothetical protein U9R53_07790 [Chloroflexota bacterium]|nr:hypothetical protein [Chloroflexota bacterium]
MRNHKYLKHLTWIGLILSILLLCSCQAGLTKTLISQTYPESGTELSAYGWVGVTFSQPMVHETVEGAFSISPDTSGQIFWEEDTIWFRPIQAFIQDKPYQAHLQGDLETADGQTITLDRTWDFSIREPELIYYVREGDLGEIWRCTSDGSQARQLSFTSGNVFDFSPDQSGSWIAFTVQNESGGRDLWIVDRDGEDQQLLINCRQDICSEPAWSIDQTWIAYSRETYTEETGGYQPSQVWRVDIHSSETSPFYQNKILFARSPSFSPDGKKLATYDATEHMIHVLDLQTLQETLIPRTLPGTVSWSSDGSQIMYTDELPAAMEPFVDIFVADMDTSEVRTALSEATMDTEFGHPHWSPDGNWVAVSLRPVNAAISKMLWVISLKGERNLAITEDQSATFSAYRWDPWGNSLVYQRMALGSSDPKVSLWRWDWQTKREILIVDNGARPEWLP